LFLCIDALFLHGVEAWYPLPFSMVSMDIDEYDSGLKTEVVIAGIHM
jgi:hypothetical protein